MSHQDWTPMILKKKEDKPKTTFQRDPNTPKVVVDENGEETIKASKVVSKEMAQEVINGRNKLGLKQSDLAKRCNLDLKTIADIEKGGVKYIPQHFNLISKVLGIKLRRV